MNDAPALAVRELTLDLPVRGVPERILHGVTWQVGPGESVGLVGGSGSGKSLTVRCVVDMLPGGAVRSGSVSLAGCDLADLDVRGRRRLLARDVGMVFQDPRAHVNPVRTVGDHLCEAAVLVHGLTRRDAADRAVGLLTDVGIDDPARRMGQLPHELSGGMLQRVAIAAALMPRPRLLLADEPTTALDVTTQEEVMAVLEEQRRRHGLAMVFITHDLDLAAAVCDRLVVMRRGEVVEELYARTAHTAARHPYTRELVAARAGFGLGRGR